MTLLATETATGRFRSYGPRHIGAIASKYGLREDVAETVRVVTGPATNGGQAR